MDNFDAADRDRDLTDHPAEASTGGTPKPPSAADRAETPDENLSLREWLLRNGTTLLLGLGVLGFFAVYFSVETVLTGIKTVVGLGFVVFIHELGHFLVAKWCDVHVETFSIGFGPALPGCQFQWGETTYMIALLPLGGYVKMVGEGDNSDEPSLEPRSFKQKTVGQRMAIISAGVVMNVLFGFACFIYVYMSRGVERQPGVVGKVDAGSPLWIKGVPTGAVIQRIGSKADPKFSDLMPIVMTSGWGAKLDFVYASPGQPVNDIKIEPRRSATDSRPIIGVTPPTALLLPPASEAKLREKPVALFSAAAQAIPPFEFGDSIIATTDPADPATILPLPVDPRYTEGKQLDWFEFRRRLVLLAGKPLVVRVVRANAALTDPPVDITVPPAFHLTLGLRMRMGKIAAIREGSPAEQAGVALGDIIKQVKVVDGAGKRLDSFGDASPDPIRLAAQLEALALAHPKATFVVTLLRPDEAKHEEKGTIERELRWNSDWQFDDVIPINRGSPEPINGLGLAFKVETTVDEVAPDSPAARATIQTATGWNPNPLLMGDVIERIRFKIADEKIGATSWSDWLSLEGDQWASVFTRMQLFCDYPTVQVYVRRGATALGAPVQMEMVVDPTWPLVDRGMILMPELHYRKANSFGEAVLLGFNDTGDNIRQVYLGLKSILNQRVGLDNVGGPLSIGITAYRVASYDWHKFVLLLGVISINLAVVNFLPIPVLDGGHMFFLVYEKIRGRSAEARVLNYATVVGIAFLLSLMVLVFFNDFRIHVYKFVFGQ